MMLHLLERRGNHFFVPGSAITYLRAAYCLEVTAEEGRNIQFIAIHSIGSDVTFQRLVGLLRLTIALLRIPLYLCSGIVILHQR